MPMMMMTIRSSIKVKPALPRNCFIALSFAIAGSHRNEARGHIA
jgi:hypothetical protein